MHIGEREQSRRALVDLVQAGRAIEIVQDERSNTDSMQCDVRAEPTAKVGSGWVVMSSSPGAEMAGDARDAQDRHWEVRQDPQVGTILQNQMDMPGACGAYAAGRRARLSSCCGSSPAGSSMRTGAATACTRCSTRRAW